MISMYNHLLQVLSKFVKSLNHLCIYPVSNTCHCTATQRWDDKNLVLATCTTTPCGQGKHLAHPANHLEHHRTSFSNIFKCPKGRTCAPPFFVTALGAAFHRVFTITSVSQLQFSLLYLETCWKTNHFIHSLM